MSEPTFTKTVTTTHTYTTRDIYGCSMDELKAPDGYRLTKRLIDTCDPANRGKWCVAYGSNTALKIHDGVYEFHGVRAELEPLPRKKRVVFEVEEGQEVVAFAKTGEVRKPMVGDWFMVADGGVKMCDCFFTLVYPILIPIQPIEETT